MNLRRLLMIVLAGLIGFASLAHAADDTFNQKQKAAIENIVHDYLLNNPNILVEVSQKLQEQQEQQMQQLQKNAQNMIPKLANELFNDNSPASGNQTGDVTLVEFFDYQCPHCKDMSRVISNAAKKDKNLRVVHKEFPIFGRSSVFASKAALAAHKQGKYDAFHEALMNTKNPLTEKKVLAAAKSVGLNVDQLKKDMDSKEIKDELNRNMRLGQQLGIMATPTFIIGSTKNASDDNSKSFFIPGGVTEDVIQNFVVQVRNS